VHESLVVCREAIAVLAGLDKGAGSRQRIVYGPMRLEILERL
jgi:hypothetical protein